MFAALAMLLLLFLLLTAAVIVLLFHAKGDLLDSLTGNSDASRTVAFLIGNGQNQIALVGIGVPRFDPGRLVLRATNGLDSCVDVTIGDFGWD